MHKGEIGMLLVSIYSDSNKNNCSVCPNALHYNVCTSAPKYIQFVAHAKENVKFLSPT